MLHPSTYEYLNPTDEQKKTMQLIRSASKDYSEIIDGAIPDGPDKTYLMRHLREVVMWINVAITRHPDGSPRKD